MTTELTTDPRAQLEIRRGRRLALLHALYERSDGDASVILPDMWTLGDGLGVPREEIVDVFAYLFEEGLAQRVDGGGRVSITHAGVKEVEAALSRPADPTPRFPPARNVIRIERAVNTVIQQGNTGSTQSVRLAPDTAADARALADALAAAVERIGAAESERAELRAQVDALRAQAASPRPRLAAVRDAATGVTAVLDGIARAGRAAQDTLPLLERAGALLRRLRS